MSLSLSPERERLARQLYKRHLGPEKVSPLTPKELDLVRQLARFERERRKSDASLPSSWAAFRPWPPRGRGMAKEGQRPDRSSPGTAAPARSPAASALISRGQGGGGASTIDARPMTPGRFRELLAAHHFDGSFYEERLGTPAAPADPAVAEARRRAEEARAVARAEYAERISADQLEGRTAGPDAIAAMGVRDSIVNEVFRSPGRDLEQRTGMPAQTAFQAEQERKARQLQALIARKAQEPEPKPNERDARKLGVDQYRALLARYGFARGVIGD